MNRKIFEDKFKFVFLINIFAIISKVSTQSWSEVLYVAQDGSGNYSTIQAAVNATRDLSQVQVKIYIKAGLYKEKLVIPSWKTKISLIGENKLTTIISNDDYWGKPLPGGLPDSTGSTTIITYTSYTVLVKGNDFTAEGLTIENTSGPDVNQAVALHVEADRVVVRDCRLLGNQDTLYTATSGSRQYYKNCYIEGTTDFIFGEAIVVFDNCTINSMKNSYITAASTPPTQQYGFVFRNCTLTHNENATAVYLGRPWRPYCKTVFLNTLMGNHILPEGWHNWDNPENEETTYYAEYNSMGVDVSDRVSWSKQLNRGEAEQYTNENIFADERDWLPEVN